jgi:hypothetical protein
MRTISIILVAILIGAVVGGALGYVEVRVDRNALSRLPGEAADLPKDLAASGPRINVPERNYDFGTMQRGTSKSHEFLIRNIGTAPLKLRKGSVTCKCTEFMVPESTPIPPGESTYVRVEWSAKSDNGPFRQTATVIAENDPITPQVELTISGTIMAVSGVEPNELLFDKLAVGESKAAQVFVMAMLQDDLAVSEPTLTDPATRDKFDIKIEPAEHDALPNKLARNGVRITVTAKPGLPLGRFDQWLSLRTNLKDAEKLEIPVAGSVVGDISVHGIKWNDERGVLNMGMLKSSEGGRENLNLVVRGPDAATTEFQVKSIEPAELKVTVGKPKHVKDNLVHVPVEVSVPAGTRPMVRLETVQGDAGRVVLSTTNPKIKELSLGVRFAVER